ncbi:MauE/DoxX family redox-associated membrane protein [Flavobacterium gelidilacus]|uniref:MauE/DoxX family redox-associated membrane protein n=1 Tax=Flavobacterium gelidilacus TaxID=206041 RepID=UPI00040B1074|nr:MauE/DoxX family redox-associated membrane protein [Flavobacterium gelidilacus]
MKNNLKFVLLSTISYLFVFLFTYAAVSKLIEFQNFQAQLGQSPLVSAYTGFISYVLLIIEFGIALLLVIPKTRYIGLVTSFTLMVMFTVYIIVILNYSSFIPCSCGGILENLNWKEHLVFNCIFTLIAATGIFLMASNKFKTILKLFSLTITSTAIILTLYLLSEESMHQENPFIRRFIQGSSYKIAEVKLDNNSKYFAGTDGKNIYLGDNLAPLHIIAYDSTLKIKKHYKIELEREDFPFMSVQVRIDFPHFYLMDGTVPVIYKGNISDWKARLWMYNNNYYFSKAEIISENKIVFRAQEIKTLNNVLGIFSFNDSLEIKYAPKLLEKQIDGFFDTDGMLNVDRNNNKIVYTYYYRNQYIIADKNIELVKRRNTIDTTTKAKLKIVNIKETGQRKIASLPATVNQITTTHNNLLYVNSKLIGRFEPKEMWKQASIVDIYNSDKGTYLSSIYIYDVNKEKLKSMFVLKDKLYVIIGQHLHIYKLNIINNNIK